MWVETTSSGNNRKIPGTFPEPGAELLAGSDQGVDMGTSKSILDWVPLHWC